MPKPRAHILAALRRQRLHLARTQPALFAALLAIFCRHDPARLGTSSREDGSDEYAAEVGTLLPRLQAADNVADVQQLIAEELAFWFSPRFGEGAAAYAALAEDVWSAYQRGNPPPHP